MLSWGHYLPPSEAEKQCKTQNILLSICLLLFFLPLLSLFSCATLTAKLWFHRRAQQRLSCFLSAFRHLKKIQMKAELASWLWTVEAKIQHPGWCDMSIKYLEGCFSGAQAKCSVLILVKRRIKTSYLRLQLDSLFLMSKKLVWNRRFHFYLGKLVLMPFSCQICTV